MKEPNEDQLGNEIRNALKERQRASFAPGFEDRVAERFRAERLQSVSIASVIERRASRIVSVALAASLLLAVYSAGRRSNSSNGDTSFVARVFGWPAEVSTSAGVAEYESLYASLYGLPQLDGSGVR